MTVQDPQCMRLKSTIVDHANIGLFAINRDLEVVLWNQFMEINSRRHAKDILGRNLFECFPELPEKWLSRKINNVFLLGNSSFTSWEQRPYLFKFPHNRTLQTTVDHMFQDSYFYPVKDDRGEVEYIYISLLDVTDVGIYQGLLKTTIDKQKGLITQLKDAQHQLQQSEKMAAVGQLAAGVAHEINNPVAFVASNLRTLNSYTSGLVSIIEAYQAAESRLDPAGAEMTKISSVKKQVDYEFLVEDLEQLLKESDEGLGRVRRIVQDLKDFSRPDTGDWGWADLHEGIDSTLNVVNNEIKYKANVIKDYGEIPNIKCIIAQLNQVFMNLIVNAAHAIEDHGTITIRSGMKNDHILVEVSDSGRGIRPEHIKQVFNPFFTTKPVGKGTGLGLSVSYGIIEKHNGRMEVESEIGTGTTFRVWLPIEPEEQQEVSTESSPTL